MFCTFEYTGNNSDPILNRGRKHVLSDLQPYLCTFEGCSTQMFQSRHEWFQHELDKHRREWHCCLCSNRIPFSSAAQLQLHLSDKHVDHSTQQTSALLALCEKRPESIALSACPFCAWYSWDPCKVLNVNPTHQSSTCVGNYSGTAIRCGWRLKSEQFSDHQRVAAVKILESMSRMDPSKITIKTLCSLAQNTLCGHHQRQANGMCHQWGAGIQDYLHEHSEWDYDVHHGPDLRAHSDRPPTVRVSSLEFERHVAHHLEQLALFALPPPMKESSGASSNQAAASDKSARTTGSDAMLVPSFASVHITDDDRAQELYAAVMTGDIESIMQEIMNGASLILPHGRFGSVLEAAAACLSWPTRDEILQALLDNGADVNMQGGFYGNALQAVAANPGVSGHRLGAMQILVQRGADVNAHGGEYGYALIAAAANPTHPTETCLESTSLILKFLLENGADPDALEPTEYVCALHQAIKHDDEESVQ